ncbi:MAG: AMP-binding protein [Proteobacteria bacterium]|nr:AMP-binding protein [Pseudomonadota bacterium]
MSAPWLDSYPDGIQAEIDLGEYGSIVEILEQSCSRHKDRTAFVNFDTRLTYAELELQTRNFAAWLQKKGLEKGDRIALVMPNILQYPIALFGALRAGLVVVNTNPMYTAREMKHQLMDSGARAIVIVENFAHVLTEISNEVPVEFVITTKIGDLLNFPKGLLMNFSMKYVKKVVPGWNLPGSVTFTETLKEGKNLSFEKPDLGHEDLAFLQYTGGTTGVAKGAMLTHRNMVANMLQSREWMKAKGIGTDIETVITALPLYHIFALSTNCMVFMSIGGTNILITDPRDMPAFIKELSKVPFSFIPGVNTLFNAMLNTPGFADLDFSTLKGALGAGMAVQRSVAKRWKEVTGITLVEAYGLTETSPGVCTNPMDLEEFNACIGLPMPSTECAIMNDEGELLPQGEKGELVVRGPQVMKGYWQRPEETAKAIDAQGWFHTGDVATIRDDGFVRFLGRYKELLKVGGENVDPVEVEAFLLGHPGVSSVQIVGVADQNLGEVACACVVLREGHQVSAEEIIGYCRGKLASFKLPKHVLFMTEYPMTPSGKVQKFKLKDQAEAALGLGVGQA